MGGVDETSIEEIEQMLQPEGAIEGLSSASAAGYDSGGSGGVRGARGSNSSSNNNYDAQRLQNLDPYHIPDENGDID